MISIIAAVSQNGIIGDANSNNIPWMGKYPEDVKFFKQKTAGATIICGRHTFESFGAKPLPKRRNIVVTHSDQYKDIGVEAVSSFKEAIDMAGTPIPAVATVDKDGKQIVPENKDNIWLIGGASIYREGMEVADTIYLTLIPEYVRDVKTPVYFPWVDPSKFQLHEDLISLENSNLKVYQYSRF
jgi:dihydrofolate reductase